MSILKQQASYLLFFLSVVLVFGPWPAYVYLVMPYAEGTRDPDAIEAIAWFGGILLMLIGSLLTPFALGIWLYTRRHNRDEITWGRSNLAMRERR